MRRTALVAAALLLPALVAGCSLDSDPAADTLGRSGIADATADPDAITLGPEVEDAPTIEFTAPVETDYEVTGPTALRPGVVNISLTSEGNHNLALTGPGLPVALLWGSPAGRPEKGLSHSVRLRLGTYTYYCSVPGHRSAGMVGTIDVNAFGVAVPPASPAPAA